MGKPESESILTEIAQKAFAQDFTRDYVLQLVKGINVEANEPLSNTEVQTLVEWVEAESVKSDKSDSSDKSTKIRQNPTKSDRIRQNPTVPTVETKRFNGNLTAEVKLFCERNQGSFTTQDVDREFGIVLRSDKQRRSDALRKLIKERRIREDRRVSGKYHILRSEFEFINMDQTTTDPFSLELPLGLTRRVVIPKKCVIILAGTSNAGKTTFSLETLRKNLDQDYPLLYLMSEMGPSEYKQRVEKICPNLDSFSTWKEKVKAAAVPAGFEGAIANHNPNGLTVIDFLEEVEGAYYQIASDIRAIYDSLENGVAIINLQKHSQANIGRGGEATTEKARLYLTLDQLAYQPKATISALKIHKAKEYIGDNPNGLECHISLNGEPDIKALTDWIYCNRTQREKYIAKYQSQAVVGDVSPEQEVVYTYELDDGSFGRLRERDRLKWVQAFPDVDVDQVLFEMADWTKDGHPFKKKGWFFQLSNILKNYQDNVKE